MAVKHSVSKQAPGGFLFNYVVKKAIVRVRGKLIYTQRAFKTLTENAFCKDTPSVQQKPRIWRWRRISIFSEVVAGKQRRGWLVGLVISTDQFAVLKTTQTASSKGYIHSGANGGVVEKRVTFLDLKRAKNNVWSHGWGTVHVGVPVTLRGEVHMERVQWQHEPFRTARPSRCS